MLTNAHDIPGTLVVFDLEWVGNSHVPATTHITEIAALEPATGKQFSRLVAPLACSNTFEHTDESIPCRAALVDLFTWLDGLRKDGCPHDPITLIAHNGIRYDMQVLLENAKRCSVPVVHGLWMLDSLFHLRHHMRFRESQLKYDIDSLAEHLDLTVGAEQRHHAAFDVRLLHSVLGGMSSKYDIPYISGLHHPFTISPLLVHGIGVTICLRLNTFSLYDLCMSIVSKQGSLCKESCKQYLVDSGLPNTLPRVDLELISKSIGVAARRHLHYLG